MNYIGCDPGKSGAIAILTPENVLFCRTQDDDEQCSKICGVLQEYASTSIAAIEDVHALYMSSAKATFAFGWGTGYWHGVFDCLKIPIVIVEPKIWQEAISKPWDNFHWPDGLTIKERNTLRKKQLKKSSIEAANRIASVSNIVHDGVADAICIAEWLRRKQIRELL